jgi:CBS domain-containing protein
MTRQVVTVGPDTPLIEAAKLMLKHRIGGLPVVDAGKTLVGIVTEGDFLHRAETGTQRRRARWLEFLIGPGQLATEYAHSTGRKVHEVMTDTVHSVSEGTALEEVVNLMERHRVKRLPVLRGKKLVGIVTRANLVRAVVGLAHEARPASVSDSEIRRLLLDELKKHSWAPAIRVAVKDGVVQLTGVLNDERQRPALRVAAENIPGVKEVVDNLVWVEPQSGLVLEGS